MQKSKNHPHQCDNCKRVLGTLLDQTERTEFCSNYCTHEWSAKKLERPLADDEDNLQHEALNYVQAVINQQAVEVAFVALLFAACKVAPELRPQRFGRRVGEANIVVTLSPIAVANLANLPRLEAVDCEPSEDEGRLFR